MTDAIDATAEEIGQEIVPASTPQVTLFRSDDPVEVLKRATEVANALKAVLVEQGMVQNIQGKGHVKVEGWVTLGAMLGVVPVVTWTRKLENGWEARVEARTLDGRVVGAAEAECLKEERRWQNADDYAVRSMAQTRAQSKALSGPLRFIVTLAGYQGTPAEEMDGVNRDVKRGKPSDAQRKLIKTLVTQKRATPAQLKVILEQIGAADVEIREGWMEYLTAGKEGTASALITYLKERPLPAVDAPSDVPGLGDEDFRVPDSDDTGVIQ